MRCLIMGAPGAGKGTYADGIKKHFGIPHISTGEIFREAIASGSEIGLLAKKLIDKGNLVPDDITNAIVKERIKKADCKDGFLFDGYPRTMAQAIAFDEMLRELNIKLDVVINIDVSDDIIISRIINRRTCPSCGRGYNIVSLKPKKEGVCDDCGTTLYQRKDDNEETIKSRLEVYNNQTKPLIDYYDKQNLLLQVDGAGSISEITKNIITGMEAK
ncbi:MAG: adenylate kinase [Bacilli bacterium]|nr:adenylate kinase [Bacilli bacterium]